MEGENHYDRIIDRHELKMIVPMHPSHLARLEAVGEFPRRIKLGRSRVGWSLYETLIGSSSARPRGDAE